MRLVVKVGTSTVGRTTPPDPIAALAGEVAALMRAGHRVAVFSSGAVWAGRRAAGANLPAAAAAAVGQPLVYARWRDALAKVGVRAAQVLVDDRHVRDGGQAAAVVEALWRTGLVPVLNGNDAVADPDSPVADNDSLAAALALALGADRLVLLTDQDGLYTRDPRSDPDARPIRRLTAAGLAACLPTLAVGRPGPHGRGGMASKAYAAWQAARGGVATVIAHGAMAEVLTAVLAGEAVGTAVEPAGARDHPRAPAAAFGAGWVACGGE
jgi:glutamate 5-kinase